MGQPEFWSKETPFANCDWRIKNLVFWKTLAKMLTAKGIKKLYRDGVRKELVK